MVNLEALYMKSICSSMDQLSKSNMSKVICLLATHSLRLNRGCTIEWHGPRLCLAQLQYIDMAHRHGKFFGALECPWHAPMPG